MLQLTLFGDFSVTSADGTEIAIKSKKAKGLLAYLALSPRMSRSREEIMALLWSDRGEEQARASLRQVLVGLRKDLGENALISTNEAIALDLDRVAIDAANPGEELLAGFHLHDPAFEDWLRDERLVHEDSIASVTDPPKLQLADKPSIAVLPFVNMSGEPEQDYFADGITEDIITELSRFRGLSVIARNSTFHYKGRSPKIDDVGRELGVQFVVEGSVRKAGKRVRINAQLIEVANNNHTWAERYDRDLEDVFAVQDEVTRTIVSTVAGRIDSVGNRRASRLSPDSLKAYDILLRAKSIFLRFTRAGNAEGRDLLKRAILLDPTNAQAHALLCSTHYMDWIGNWVRGGDKALNEAIFWGKRAVAADDADCLSHWNLGEAYLFARDFEKSRFHFQKAIDLNPNDVEARTAYGFFLTCVREIPEALAEFEWARKVDPQDLNWLPWLEGFAYFTARQFDDAIACFERIEDPHYEVYSLLSASYAHIGLSNEAKAMLEQFLHNAEHEMVDFPGRSLAAWRRIWRSPNCYKDVADADQWFDGLRKAGLPE